MIAAAGEIKSIDVSGCGMDGLYLPTPIIARLPYLQELHCIAKSEVKKSKLRLRLLRFAAAASNPSRSSFSSQSKRTLSVLQFQLQACWTLQVPLLHLPSLASSKLYGMAPMRGRRTQHPWRSSCGCR